MAIAWRTLYKYDANKTACQRMINWQIRNQDLSNQREAQKAKLLREFVKTELELGKVAEGISIPDAYDAWKQSKLDAEIAEFAQLKGLDSVLLKKSYERFDMKHPLAIPQIDELTDTAQCEGDALDYALELEQDIPEWMKQIKLKYSQFCYGIQSPCPFVRRRVPASITQRLSCQGRLIQTPQGQP